MCLNVDRTCLIKEWNRFTLFSQLEILPKQSLILRAFGLTENLVSFRRLVSSELNLTWTISIKLDIAPPKASIYTVTSLQSILLIKSPKYPKNESKFDNNPISMWNDQPQYSRVLHKNFNKPNITMILIHLRKILYPSCLWIDDNEVASYFPCRADFNNAHFDIC